MVMASNTEHGSRAGLSERFKLAQLLLLWLTIIMTSPVRPNSTPSVAAALAVKRALPKKLLIGYGHNADHVRTAVHDGVNVVCWVFMDIVATENNDGESSSHRELLETGEKNIAKRKAEIKTEEKKTDKS